MTTCLPRGFVGGWVLTLLVSVTAPAAQDWRGTGRVSGRVTDESGQPVEDVAVKAVREGASSGPQTKTNKKGEWSIIGVAGGRWHFEFSKQGYQTGSFDTQANEQSTNMPVTTQLKKAAVDPNVAITADLAKAADLMKQKQYSEARAIYEGVLAKHPEAYQIEPYIARTYYEEKNLDQAAAHLRTAVEKDPDNPTNELLLAQVLAEKGDTEGSRQLMASVDDSKITDPTMMLNVGIGLFNQQKPDEALAWFDKTVTRFPQYPDGYYYRGLTDVQLGKTDRAKADLEKFVQMAPNAPEAATAKGILDKLK